ncbi:MAG: cyclic nucleotide-binding domain-containing protein [Dehalococcoidia bacterium]|nr:cyclic nucleotide-binding domain-containing protein [Dehalococcoidia bacterium]
MAAQVTRDVLKKVSLFRGLSEEELDQIAKLCSFRGYEGGALCQFEGQMADQIHFIHKGKVGVEFHIPNIAYGCKDIVLDTLGIGDIFGWSALLKGTPWATLRTIEPTEVIHISAPDLLGLCNSNNHIGYVVMKNLATIITSRLRRNRVATLNAIVAIRGGW